jgi:hypothetical protein
MSFCCSNLVALAIVLQTAGTFAVAAFVVPARFGTPSDPDLGLKSMRIAI